MIIIVVFLKCFHTCHLRATAPVCVAEVLRLTGEMTSLAPWLLVGWQWKPSLLSWRTGTNISPDTLISVYLCEKQEWNVNIYFRWRHKATRKMAMISTACRQHGFQSNLQSIINLNNSAVCTPLLKQKGKQKEDCFWRLMLQGLLRDTKKQMMVGDGLSFTGGIGFLYVYKVTLVTGRRAEAIRAYLAV